MAPRRHSAEGPAAGPSIELNPSAVREGDLAELRGTGWEDSPIVCAVGGRQLVPVTVAAGYAQREGIRPDGHGTFVFRFETFGLKPGAVRVVARSTHRTKRAARATLRVEPRPAPDPSPEPGDVDLSFWRGREFLRRRFGHLSRRPPGFRDAQISSVRQLRTARDRGIAAGPPAAGPGMNMPNPEPPGTNPAPGVCNWTPVGAGPVAQGIGRAYSGRTRAIAHDPTTASTVYIGTAGGGVWKSTNSGDTWTPKSDYQRSLAIGAIAIDPNDHLHVLAGTGEYNNGSIGTYYGNGVLRSNDGGDTWAETGTTTFQMAETSRLAFDPTDATGQTVFLSGSIGVYASTDGGTNWSVLRPGNASDLAVLSAAGPPGTVKLIGAFFGSGLWTSTRTGGVWSAWTQISDPALPPTFGRIVMAQHKADPRVVYVQFAAGVSLAGTVKTVDGGATWAVVAVRLNTPVSSGSTAAGAPLHTHSVAVPAADMTAAAAAHSYTSTTDSGHAHSVPFAAAEFQGLAAGASETVTTTADATGHQHLLTLSATSQTGYDLHIAVHPTDPNVVFIGEVRLWRNKTGGGTFDSLPILHTDQHAFAFEPSGTTCWAVGDGGVYRSADGGDTWVHRNVDLATLQYISVSQHPQWENVMLAGTQDNGTHRYIGNPAWTFANGGDGGFTAIDPSLPTRMYHQYIRSTFYRSDTAGASGSWVLKNSGIFGVANFYCPFALDPSDSNTCYFGGAELFRSADNADTWNAITGGVAASGDSITALAVHPTDSTTIYVGTVLGKLYRVQRTGATWAIADVTRTDLTAGLPGATIGDLAVDSAGTVWVAIAAVLASESSGEFTSEHVFKRSTTDATWVQRTNGLALANPINTIVIDPMNSSRLFCGGDVGVFRTENAGVSWTPWDEGLPNAPVFDLQLHANRRLLRAATHGRSIWERPIDAAMCPMVDLYLRDDVLDSGRVVPAPSGVPHPFMPATNVYWWHSPDVKVDAPEPNFQTVNPVSDYVAFETDITHRSARRGRVNRFYAQVHNRGVSPATNVRVRAFFASAAAGLPSLPADFWMSPNPWGGTPSTADWTPVGPEKTLPSLAPATPAVLSWDWPIPNGASEHSCLLVVATCDQDPPAGSERDPTTLVTTRKQVTLKNLQVLDPVAGGVQPEEVLVTELNNGSPDEEGVFDLHVHFGTLPPRTRVHAVLERLPSFGGRRVPKDQDRDGRMAARDGAKLFPRELPGKDGYPRVLDLSDVRELKPASERRASWQSVVVPAGTSRAFALRLTMPKRIPPEGLQFDVVQQRGDAVVGGNTYRIEPPAKEKRVPRAGRKPT